MPFTASKTDAETSAATRVVTIGLDPPASTVSFIIPIHSSTESGVAAAASLGAAIMPLRIRTQHVAIRKLLFICALLWGRANMQRIAARVNELRLDWCRNISGQINQ